MHIVRLAKWSQILKKYKTIIFILLLFSKSTYADNWIQAYSDFNKPTYGFVSRVLSNKQIVFGGHNNADQAILCISDEYGSIKATKRLENCKYLKVVLETNDKNIFVCGINDTAGNQGNNIFWMKLDLNLNIIWSNQNSRIFNDVIESGIQHSNGTFFLVGYGSRSGNELSDRDALIYNIDATGKIINSKISNNFGTDYFNNIRELPDGNVVIAGTKLWQVAMDYYLIKMSPSLNTINSITLGGIDNEGAYDLQIINSAIYIVGGTYSFGFGGYDVLLSKLDLDLNVEFSKAYGLGSDEYPTSLIALNNEFIIAGNLDTIEVPDSTFVPIKSFFLKVDFDGNLISSKIFKEQSIIYNINAVCASTENEVVCMMSSDKFTANPSTAMVLFKTDSFKFSCCDYFKDLQIFEKNIIVSSRAQTFGYNPAGPNKNLNSNSINYSLEKVLSCGPLNDSAKINIERRPYCVSELIDFNVTNSINPITFKWEIGDSTINNIKELEYKFDSAGSYLVYYIANYNCNSDTDTFRINIVKEIPYEVFLNKNGFCIGKPIVFFADSSTSDIVHYKWDFGVPNIQNDTSNLTRPSFIYRSPGTYLVKLFSKSKCGSKVDSITINIPQQETASIEKNLSTYCKFSTVPFSINTTSTATSITWNFGDPSSSNNISTNPAETHIYNNPGKYICTLISNFECNSDTDTIHIYIIDYIQVTTKIQTIGSCITDPFFFDLDHPLFNVNYFWDIQGPINYTFNTKSFNHKFTQSGNYTIYASVLDDNCQQGLDTLEIYVSPFIEASIEVTNDKCLTSTRFKSSNYSEKILWKLSDGYTSTEQSFNYTFSESGTYDVTLITNPNSSCEDSTTESVTVTKENLNGGIFYPEIISPNDDGKNDIFFIENTTNNPCKIKEFKIFDRWGKIIFNSKNNTSFEWDGKFNGKPVIPGAYIGFIQTDSDRISFILHVVY